MSVVFLFPFSPKVAPCAAQKRHPSSHFSNCPILPPPVSLTSLFRTKAPSCRLKKKNIPWDPCSLPALPGTPRAKRKGGRKKKRSGVRDEIPSETKAKKPHFPLKLRPPGRGCNLPSVSPAAGRLWFWRTMLLGRSTCSAIHSG